MEHPGKSCPLTNELFQEVKEGAMRGPEFFFKTLQGDLVKKAFLSFFEVRREFLNYKNKLLILEGC